MLSKKLYLQLKEISDHNLIVHTRQYLSRKSYIVEGGLMLSQVILLINGRMRIRKFLFQGRLSNRAVKII